MKRHNILLTLLAALAIASCSKSPLTPSGPIGPGGENPDLVRLSLGAGAMGYSQSSVGTRSTQQPLVQGTEDAQIHDLWAIQYDEGGNLVGVPYYTADIPAGTAGSEGSGNDIDYAGLSLRLTSSAGKSHTVVFVANTGDGTLFPGGKDISTLAKLDTVTRSIGREYRPDAASGIAMYGSYTGVVASATPINGVKMERLAATVILKYKASLAGFTITGVQMKSVAAGIGFCPATTGATDRPAKAEGSHIDYPAEDLRFAVSNGGYKVFTFYLPENLRKATGTVAAIGDRTLEKTDGAATHIEITGILREGDRCRKATLKVLLGDLGTNGTAYSDFNVKRNTVYTVTVDIKGLNEGDYRLSVESFDMSNSAMVLPAETEGTPRDSVVFDIRKCLANGFTTQSQLNGMLGEGSALTADVLWQDGDVVNTKDVTLDKVNGLLTVRSSKEAVGNAVVALYPDASKAQGTILWSWHVWVTDYRPSQAGFQAREMNTAYPVDGGQVHTYGTEFRKANGPSKTIMDRNLGATEAYYSPAEANAAGAKAERAFGMFYQWGRKDPFPRADGSTINPTTAAANTIPIYGPDGTTKLADEVTDAAGTGYRMIKIWTVMSGTNTLVYTIKNPLAFIYNTALPSDWYATETVNQNNDLWGNGGVKSVYDPCPKGWRVPPDGTWSDFTRDEATPTNGTFPYYSANVPGETYAAGAYKVSNGRYYAAAGAWYPAPGSRHRYTGVLTNVGSEGSVWSGTTNSEGYALRLLFTEASLIPNHAHSRAYGFQVRCVQYVE